MKKYLLGLFVLILVLSVDFGTQKVLAWKDGDTLGGDMYCNPPGLWYTIGHTPSGCGKTIVSDNQNSDSTKATAIKTPVKIVITTADIKEVSVSVDGEASKKYNLETDSDGKKYILVPDVQGGARITIEAEGYKSLILTAPQSLVSAGTESPITAYIIPKSNFFTRLFHKSSPYPIIINDVPKEILAMGDGGPGKSGSNPPETQSFYSDCLGSNCGTFQVFKSVPGHPSQVFHFMLSYIGNNGMPAIKFFDLDDDPNTILSNTRTFSVFTYKYYYLQEIPTSGFTANVYGGTPSGLGSAIQLLSNTMIFMFQTTAPSLWQVTYVNTPYYGACNPNNYLGCGSFHLSKIVPGVPAHSTHKVFHFSISGIRSSGASTGTKYFDLDDDSSTAIDDSIVLSVYYNTMYTIHEDPTPGFIPSIQLSGYYGGQSFPDASTVKLQSGGGAGIIFKNTKTGTIKIIKKTLYIGLNGSQYSAPSPLNKLFNFSTTGGLSLASFVLDTNESIDHSDQQVFNNLPPGAYTVTEGPASPGGGVISTLQSISCLVYVGNTIVNTLNSTPPNVTINLHSGENVVCTFTNLLTQ